MLLDSVLYVVPAPRQRLRFRIIIACLCLLVSGLLVAQYTAFRLLPETKTSTVWGLLAGLTAVTAFMEYRWRLLERWD